MADLTKALAAGLAITQKVMDARWDKEIEDAGRDGLPMEYVRVLELEASGGPCPQCNKPWKRIEVRNRHGHFDYFNPVCRCYPRCPGITAKARNRYKDGEPKPGGPTIETVTYECGASLHREVARGDETPMCSCGWNGTYDRGARRAKNAELSGVKKPPGKEF